MGVQFQPQTVWFLKPKLQTVGGLRKVVEPPPLTKYARQNGFIFPKDRGEHKKYLKPPPLYIHPRQLANITTISSNQTLLNDPSVSHITRIPAFVAPPMV